MSAKLQLSDIDIEYEGMQITRLIVDKYGSVEKFIEETGSTNTCTTIKRYLRERRVMSKKLRLTVVNAFDKGWDELIKPVRVQLEEYARRINRNMPAYNSLKDVEIANRLMDVCKKEIEYNGEYRCSNEDIMKEHTAEAERLRCTLSKLYRAKGMMYFYSGESGTAEEFINLALEQIKGKTTDLMIYYYSDLGLIATYNMQKDRALNKYEMAKFYVDCLKGNVDEYIMFYFHYCYASALLNVKYYELAERSLRECMRYADEPDNVGAVYMKLGAIYTYQGDFDNALKMYLSSIEVINNEMLKAIIYNNIAVIYKDMDKMGIAIEYIDRAINLVKGKSFQYEILCNFTLCEINIMQGNDIALASLFELLQDTNNIYMYKEDLIRGIEALVKMLEKDKAKLTELRNYLYNMTKAIRLNKTTNEFFSELSKCYVLTLHCLEKLEKRVKP